MSSISPLLNPVRWFLIITAIVAVLALGLIGVRSWLAARTAMTQLSATIASQKKLIDQATAQEQQRDAAAAKAVASIKQAKAAVKTPVAAAAQIPEVLTQALPHLPAPINIDLPAPSASEPNPPATATVPATDLQPIYDEIQDCRVCQTKLAAAQSDLSDERTKEAALSAERDAATKAAHGGSFWSRAKSSAKWLLLGAAAGAIAAEAINHNAH